MKYVVTIVAPLLLGFVGYLVFSETARVEVVRHVEAVVPDVLHRGPTVLLFTGDVMLDRGVATHARKYGDDSLFRGVESLMLETHAVVVNLETTLTHLPPVAVPNGEDLRFTSDPRFAALLSDLGVRVATLSNNHTDDFGAAGLAATKEHLDVADITYYGSPSNTIADATGKRKIGGRTICFAGYEGFIKTDPTPIASDIRLMRPDCDFLVATMHAGEEYQQEPTWLQTNAAHAFIDAGADVVIGTHPHIVQPLELYKGKPVFYSLGNFIFDQDFSWNTTHGLLVRVTLSDEETQYDVLPIQVIRAEASPITDAKDESRLLTMLTHSTWTKELRTDISTKKSFIIR